MLDSDEVVRTLSFYLEKNVTEQSEKSRKQSKKMPTKKKSTVKKGAKKTN
jgi:hypothetical protein